MLRTPSAIEGEGGAITENQARARNRMLQVRDQMAQLAAENGLKVSPGIEAGLLPTPVAAEGTKAPAQQTSEMKSKTGQVWLSNAAKDMEISWGKFAPAIARWEAVLGRQAPAPTKPDGKDGAHRLSSAFTEWMMGLPAGWITDVGLSRNDELKACGNGVVPQQAALALRVLLAGIPFDSEPGGGRVLPTPTVMDQQSMPLRAVAVKNLKRGRNRGIGLNNLIENIGLDWQDGDTFTVVDGKVTKDDPEQGECEEGGRIV